MKQTKQITFGSLFAGIGGLDLGLERAGMTCKWQVEIEDYPTKILQKHWPKVKRYRDINKINPVYMDRVDLMCGGFPCQDLSFAGKGAGLHGERSGLFFEIIRLVRFLRPRVILLENVSALLNRGAGEVFGTLAKIGYNAQWDCLPAAAVGAPHRRDRIFIVAYSRGEKPRRISGFERETISKTRKSRQNLSNTNKLNDDDGRFRASEVCRKQRKSTQLPRVCPDCCGQAIKTGIAKEGKLCQSCKNFPNTDSTGLEGHGRSLLFGEIRTQKALGLYRSETGQNQWITEPDVGRVANGVPLRVDRLKCLGNAVVPQVAEFIGRRIMDVIFQ